MKGKFLSTEISSNRSKEFAQGYAMALLRFLLLAKVNSKAIIFLFVSVLFSLRNHHAAAQSLYHMCDSSANFSDGSTHATNLNALLSSLISNASTRGFSTGTFGSLPEQVYGLFLCRGDTSRANCSACLNTATQEAQQSCPYNKGATIWFDSCLLHYSYPRSLTSSDTGVLLWNTKNAPDASRFQAAVDSLMSSISNYTAYNSTARFATGETINSSQLPVLYGLAQCLPDLPADQCSSCLQSAIMDGRMRSAGMQGGRVLRVSCNYRYEMYSFYQTPPMVRLQLSSVPPASPPVNSSPQPFPSPAAAEHRGKKNVTSMVIAIIVPLVSALAVISGLCICFWKRRAHKKLSQEKTSNEITTFESILYDLITIRAATANFSDVNKLGRGGFGIVYKGVLSDGREIAVKRLSAGSSQGVQELKNELVLLAKLHHRNLVRLSGVCLEGDEKLLVYEYVANRSLDAILFDAAKRENLSWAIRYKIIGGIARGLLYLHQDSQLKIIHRDLKPSNILLDRDMNPKISDFGMARLFGSDQTQEITRRVVGTYGYMSPEYAMHGHFSTKSDAYSFGVIVLEVVAGNKNGSFLDSEHAEDLLSYTWNNWINGTVSDIIDPLLEENYPRSEVLRCIHIALLCVQEDPYDRPNMSTVVLMLERYSVSLQAPAKPAFVIGKNGNYSNFLSIDLSKSTQDRSSTKSIPMSQNEVSITELDPR